MSISPLKRIYIVHRSHSSAHWRTTSSDYPDIVPCSLSHGKTTRSQTISTIKEPRNTAHDDDILSYVHSRIHDKRIFFADRVRADHQLANDIVKNLIEKAQGMYESNSRLDSLVITDPGNCCPQVSTSTFTCRPSRKANHD